jgi:hypothetical protein
MELRETYQKKNEKLEQPAEEMKYMSPHLIYYSIIESKISI